MKWFKQFLEWEDNLKKENKMANAVLGLGSGQAASLNSDLIEKLKTADRKATVSPVIEAKTWKFAPEKREINNITTKSWWTLSSS